jgi:hypothetical protein
LWSRRTAGGWSLQRVRAAARIGSF